MNEGSLFVIYAVLVLILVALAMSTVVIHDDLERIARALEDESEEQPHD